MGFLFMFMLLSIGPFMMVKAFFDKSTTSQALTKEFAEDAIRSSVEQEKAIREDASPSLLSSEPSPRFTEKEYQELVMKNLQRRILSSEEEPFTYPPSMDAPEWDEIKQEHRKTLDIQSKYYYEQHGHNLQRCDEYCEKIKSLGYVLNNRDKERLKLTTHKLLRHRLIHRLSRPIRESDVTELTAIRIELINLYAVVESYRLQETNRIKVNSYWVDDIPSAPPEEKDSISQMVTPHLPQDCSAIAQLIDELITKIDLKKTSLDQVDMHRFETLQKDYVMLKDAYFSYDDAHRDDLQMLLKEGLKGIKSKLTEIHTSLLEGGQYQIRHRVEVIRNR